jgi:HTH-type transcriptional regulator / antitoxin HigA
MTLGIDFAEIDLAEVTMTYPQLLDYFEPRPIECDEQYWAMQKIIAALLAKPTLSTAEQSYLHLLSMLMEAYDEQQETIPELRGVALLRALIDESELKQRDLISIFKHESILSDILSGRRRLTVAHIDKLAAFFGLPHQLFFERGLAAHRPDLVDFRAFSSEKSAPIG